MIFLDTETTGLLKPEAADISLQPYIVEICVVVTDSELNFDYEFETFVKPPVPIPDEVIKITGISSEDIAYAPTFTEIYEKLCYIFTGEDTLVAHNATYDIGVLACELRRMEKEFAFPWPYNQICTVEKSYILENRRLSLGKLHKRLTGKEHNNAHRAKNDVYAMIRSFQKMKELGLV